MAQAQTGSGTKPNSPTNAHRPQRSFVGDVPTSIAESVAEPLKVAEGEFLGVAEAMPEEKYGFVPTSGKFDDARSFAEQVKHSGLRAVCLFSEFEGKKPPDDCEKGGHDPAKTKAELIKISEGLIRLLQSRDCRAYS